MTTKMRSYQCFSYAFPGPKWQNYQTKCFNDTWLNFHYVYRGKYPVIIHTMVFSLISAQSTFLLFLLFSDQVISGYNGKSLFFASNELFDTLYTHSYVILQHPLVKIRLKTSNTTTFVTFCQNVAVVLCTQFTPHFPYLGTCELPTKVYAGVRNDK